MDNIKQWLSYHQQVKLIRQYAKPDDRILIIGNEDGLIKPYLETKFGYKSIITLDINNKNNPDIVMDIKNINKLKLDFDLIVCCEVLEHLPFKHFEEILTNLSMMTNYLILSLPVNGVSLTFSFTAWLSRIFCFNIQLPIKTKIYDQHYWEINKNVNMVDIINIISKYYKILKAFNYKYNPYHYFLVLKTNKR